MKCRHCQSELQLSLADIGTSPPSNAYLNPEGLNAPEKWYPLRVLVCTSCWLAQTEDYTGREELFSTDYAYFSSFSSSWLNHCRTYTEDVVARFSLGRDSQVIEVAANDGYLLQYFQERQVPCLGIEPTTSTANAARAKGINIVEDFFGVRLAQSLNHSGYSADLTIANNVLAHVPDINDFVSGFREILKPEGVATFEFPHLYRLVTERQFDTIYHEHFSYLSLTSTKGIFASNGLTIFDVEEISTHGGSLRVYAQRTDTGKMEISDQVAKILKLEAASGMLAADFYRSLQKNMIGIKRQLLEFLLSAQARGESVVGYGAAAKGNTLINYCGIRADLLSYVVDLNPAKQGRFLPGSRIPIVSEERLVKDRPDWILILPWNIRDEVLTQLDYAREWGARFATAIPYLVTH